MIGRPTCHMHGGKTPRGFAHPSTKTGRYSRDLPTRLVADYEVTRLDPHLLELRDEVSVVHTRILDLIKRVDSGESGHLWRQLQSAFHALTAALREQDQDGIRTALTDMNTLIARGTQDYLAWEEASKQIDRKQRLIESERRRALELGQVATAEQLVLFLKVHQDAILEVITDQRQLTRLQFAISQRFRARGLALPDGPDHGDLTSE